MHWLDDISLDGNLISGCTSDSNCENSEGINQSRTQKKEKRRRHAHFKLNGRLDRKSSRGMIYENEELRLRTININAEVERGQTDIKRLRRENEQLRREIWTLRDECDRLNKRFKAKLLDNSYDHGCGGRGSGGSSGVCAGRRGSCDGEHSNSNSEDSDSCDTCKGDNDLDDYKYTPNDCCSDGSCKLPPTKTKYKQQVADELCESGNNVQNSYGLPASCSDSQPLHTTFDHLSVVSEETTLSQSEVLPTTTTPTENLLGFTPDLNGSQTTLPSLVGPLTPLTPIELVANQLNDLQAVVPPLSYFENIVQQHMDTNFAVTPESARTTNSGKTVINTNGWDYNLRSPFTQRKYSSNNSSSSSAASRSPSSQPRYAAQTLSTFVTPTTTLTPPPPTTDRTVECEVSNATSNHSNVETVAITTAPTIGAAKHFFAPLKPRLKINTSLANRNLSTTTVPLPPTVPPVSTQTKSINSPVTTRKCDPPDIFVANALASPYQRNPLPSCPTPQRQSPQVSQSNESKQLSDRHKSNFTDHVATAAAVDDLNTNSLQQPLASQKLPKTNEAFTKHNEPIYAMANKNCHHLNSAPAVTQPLMTTCTDDRMPSTTASSRDSSLMSTTTSVGPKQTDSANLETILNDIETISEDILAIQLERNKSRVNVNNTDSSNTSQQQTSKALRQDDKNKKPYRSEMNLFLTYDGTNSTITPATALSNEAVGENEQSAVSESEVADTNNTLRRARSLEREHTDSPSPNVPDPMAPFPANRTYIGFDQLNASVGNSKPPLPPQVPAVSGTRPGTPNKGTPPTPPLRVHTPKSSLPSSPQHCNSEQVALMQNPNVAPIMSGLSPNKSHLFAAIANAAAAKRALLRSSPSHLTRSLDTDGSIVPTPVDLGAQAEAARRKARRVSIVCGDNNEENRNESNLSSTALGSCKDLRTTNPSILAMRQSSHSTPNSPHTLRRSNGIMENQVNGGLAQIPSVHHQHQQHLKASQDTTSGCNGESSITAPVDLANVGAPSAAVASRSKCSRRHSDGTVASGVQRISGASGHHNRHHHNHHPHSQHQQTSSMLSNNPHNSHHSHQDSNHDTGTTISDRNSNSIASSSESSNSFSVRSHRRKISVSSHTGGKIPWCGCWGNGCL